MPVVGSLAWYRLDVPVAKLARPWRYAITADAELVVAVPTDEALTVGAFDRAVSAVAFRRASGGAPARVGPGTVFVSLALARADALVPSTAAQLLNRYVRPLLTAITKVTSKPARYFGRDWIAVGNAPVAMIGFGHEAKSGSAVVEAVVSAKASFAVDVDRPSFRGRSPAVLDVDPNRLADAILDAYRSRAETTVTAPLALDALEDAAPVGPEPPWQAKVDEAIGVVAAGRDAHGVMRVGGELMASRDAIARLEELLVDERADVAHAVGEALSAPGVVTFGVRSLSSIRDAIVSARVI